MPTDPPGPEIPPAHVAEARAITEQVRAALREHLRTGVAAARAVRRAHEARVWVALQYGSWADYANCEFGISRAAAYRLVDMAVVIEELEQAAMDLGMSPIGDIIELSRQQAREIKGRVPEVKAVLTAVLPKRDVGVLTAAQSAQLVTEAVDRVRGAGRRDRAPAAVGEPEHGGEGSHTVPGQRRGKGGEDSTPNLAAMVLGEMIGVRHGIARALALTEKFAGDFTDELGAALAECCAQAVASLTAMRELTISGNASLSEAALQALLGGEERRA